MFIMNKYKIKFTTVSDVVAFVNACSKCVGDVLAYGGRYIVSAKSIMGMYSLDLSKPIEVEFQDDIPVIVMDEIKSYIIEQED